MKFFTCFNHQWQKLSDTLKATYLYLLVVRLKTNQTFSFATKHKEKEKKWNKFKSLFVLSLYLDCSVWTNDQLREIWMFLFEKEAKYKTSKYDCRYSRNKSGCRCWVGLTGSVSLLNRAGLHWNHSMIVSHFLEIKINTRNYDVFVEIALTSFHIRRKVSMDHSLLS